ncbi:amidase domain-containing protein [Micromonospora sp. KC721]|uniref:amidase domain-containing protein n=1 Tax=Micromonospora sp. KC721 TaxID=2530380 RepID=UPI00352DEC6A
MTGVGGDCANFASQALRAGGWSDDSVGAAVPRTGGTTRRTRPGHGSTSTNGRASPTLTAVA